LEHSYTADRIAQIAGGIANDKNLAKAEITFAYDGAKAKPFTMAKLFNKDINIKDFEFGYINLMLN